MRYWALWWLILSCLFHHTHHSSPGCCNKLDYLTCEDNSETSNSERNDADHARCCMKTFKSVLKNVDNPHDTVKAFETLREILEETEVRNTTTIAEDNLLALLYKPNEDFKGLEISASENEVTLASDVQNESVKVSLPSEINAGPNNTIVFCMLQLSNKILSLTIEEYFCYKLKTYTCFMCLERSENLSDHRLIGLSVRGKNISGLNERINFTMKMTARIKETLIPQCVFLNSMEKKFSNNGCETQHNQSHVICSCDHLTYFGVLMVSADLSATDVVILSYITNIGCSISLIALLIAVLLFITNRKLRGDDSKKIHISLAVALILLNVHFLLSQSPAAVSSELCLYVALLIHYSLLASFTWMGIEGLHVYLLLVKVFNIYVKRYLIKLSVVGWGLPAVIVSVVVIIDKDIYGRTPLDSSRPNETAVCYITNRNVKMGTTLGLFSMVLLFNGIVFGMIAKWLIVDKLSKPMGTTKKNKAKSEMFTLFSLMVLLGLTWGLIFFSFGQLTTPGLYVFCIINPLQGLFILIYFVLSVYKSKVVVFKPSTQTSTTKS